MTPDDHGTEAMRADNQPGEASIRMAFNPSLGKSIRIDQPEEGDEAHGHPLESGRLIDLVLGVILNARSERRRSTRHTVTEDVVSVGWWIGEVFATSHGSVQNVSRGGAKIVLEDCPPERQPVWIFKEVESRMESVKAQVVGHSPAPRGTFAVRFRFTAPCPTLLCQAMLCSRKPAAGRRVEE
jgi:hypothetical protein